MADEGQVVNNPVEDSSASADMQQAAQMDSVINRRSRWISSLAALRYVSSVHGDDDIKVRDSDRATTIALLVCCVIALACLVFPQLEQHRITFVVAADLLVGLALLMYVANRFGIVTTFKPRQAVLTWQLMLGSSLLGIFLTINLALVLALVVQNSHVVIPH